MKSLALLFGLVLVWQSMPATQAFLRPPHSQKNTNLVHGVNGGTNCVVCTALVGIAEQLAIVYNETFDESLSRFCNYLPDGIFRLTCKEAVLEFGPIIITG